MKLRVLHTGFDQRQIGGTTGYLPGLSYDFTITVDPCKITDYASSDIVADMSYTIGDFMRGGRREL